MTHSASNAMCFLGGLTLGLGAHYRNVLVIACGAALLVIGMVFDESVR